MKYVFFAIVTHFLFAMSAQAAGVIKLNLIAQQEKVVVSADGVKEIKLVKADKVIPGEIVIYTLEVENTSDLSADNVVITDPVPEHMTYMEDLTEAEGVRVLYSVDGGIIYDTPENLQVQGDDGQMVTAKKSDYTHIKWNFDKAVPAKSETLVRFSAKLN
uniref:DUF11 domain-containing protein n=1 Tax=Marinobacterium profundum TaxID=1714300 RepID=UPI00083307C7|nr:DUF11 domain-containing protein [Marinobacterium profundum]